MNLQQAKQIPIMYFFRDILGLKGKVSGSDILYCSPFRDDTSPSYSVSIEKNISYDFATGEARDIVGAIADYYKISMSEALKKLAEFTQKNIPKDTQKYIPKTENKRHYNGRNTAGKGGALNIQNNQTEGLIACDKAQIKEVKELFYYPLKNYIKDIRKISIETASIYLNEVHYTLKDDTRVYFGLAWKNLSGGYEITRYSTQYQKSFKTAIGSKDITFIQGFDTNTILIFEGMFDFLSYLEYKKEQKLNEDVIILNSVSCHRVATEFIKMQRKYREVHLYLDNDEEGIKAVAKIKKALGIKFGLVDERNRGTRKFTNEGAVNIGDIMSKIVGIMVYDKSDLYDEYKDINDWWVINNSTKI